MSELNQGELRLRDSANGGRTVSEREGVRNVSSRGGTRASVYRVSTESSRRRERRPEETRGETEERWKRAEERRGEQRREEESRGPGTRGKSGITDVTRFLDVDAEDNSHGTILCLLALRSSRARACTRYPPAFGALIGKC